MSLRDDGIVVRSAPRGAATPRQDEQSGRRDNSMPMQEDGRVASSAPKGAAPRQDMNVLHLRPEGLRLGTSLEGNALQSGRRDNSIPVPQQHLQSRRRRRSRKQLSAGGHFLFAHAQMPSAGSQCSHQCSRSYARRSYRASSIHRPQQCSSQLQCSGHHL